MINSFIYSFFLQEPSNIRGSLPEHSTDHKREFKCIDKKMLDVLAKLPDILSAIPDEWFVDNDVKPIPLSRGLSHIEQVLRRIKIDPKDF